MGSAALANASAGELDCRKLKLDSLCCSETRYRRITLRMTVFEVMMHIVKMRMHMDSFSPLLCEHSVPVIWCFYISPPNFYFSHRRLSKLWSTDKSTELTGLHREVRENSKLK